MTKISRIAALVAACGSVGAFASIAAAADVNAAASGDWSAPGTWTPNEPTAADNALINGGFTVGVTQAGEVANRVDVGTASGASGTLTLSSGNLDVGSAAGVDPSLRLGTVLGATGTVNMTGGSLNVRGAVDGPLSNGDLQIGRDGLGIMNQSGGTSTISDEIILGTGPGSNGTLNLTGGTMTNGTRFAPESGTGRSIIAGFGLNSTGTINVSGTAVLTVRNDVVLGFFDNGSGTLNLGAGGTINATFLFSSVSANTTSTINHTGGTLNTLGAVVIAQRGQSTYNHSGGNITGGTLAVADDGTGIYNISGTANATLRDQILIGVFNPSNGTLNQSGGTLVAPLTVVGRDGIGVYNQSAGVLNTDRVLLGDFDVSSGTHRISGGTLNVTGSYSVGGALASNAPPDATRVGDQGQALGVVGNLIVRGSAATINIGGDFLANPADRTRPGTSNAATLTFEILDPTGTSLVNVGGEGDLDGAAVDLDLFSFTPSNGQVFNLISALGGFGNTGTGTTQMTGTGQGYTLLAEDTANWTLRVVGGQTAGSEILQAVYQVPEPTSLAALGLSTVLLRRRRGAAR